MSAGERRDEILQAAVTEFAIKGLHGTSTEAIAARAGVSQPYLFRLFGTKKGLFLAAVERGFDRVRETFRVAAESAGDDRLKAMGLAYGRLLGHREELLLQMQAYAACSDPEVKTLVQRRYGELWEFVAQVSGASDDEAREFFSHGMLLNVAAAMDLPAIQENTSWVRTCLSQD